MPHQPTPVRALPRDARRLRTLWDQLKENEAPMATADIATFLCGALSPESFALASDLLSRQRCLFKRAAPLGGWVPLSRPASENAQRNYFREEVEAILAGKKCSHTSILFYFFLLADTGRAASFESPEHAEALDNLCLYYLSSINGSRSAYVSRQLSSAALLHVRCINWPLASTYCVLSSRVAVREPQNQQHISF